MKEGTSMSDEFVTKPFSPGVLMARVKANLRRQSFFLEKMESYIEFGPYTLLLGSCVCSARNDFIGTNFENVPSFSARYSLR